MIRRSIAAAALAGALVLAPTAAFAAGTYPAPENALTCSATQVPAGTEFSCTVGGPNGASVELTVTLPGGGTQKYGPVVIVDNKAVFTITAPTELGVLGVSATIDGEAVDTASVEVIGTSTGTDDDLASTGFENAGLAVGAGVLLVAGAATVFVAARRRQTQDA